MSSILCLHTYSYGYQLPVGTTSYIYILVSASTSIRILVQTYDATNRSEQLFSLTQPDPTNPTNAARTPLCCVQAQCPGNDGRIYVGNPDISWLKQGGSCSTVDFPMNQPNDMTENNSKSRVPFESSHDPVSNPSDLEAYGSVRGGISSHHPKPSTMGRVYIIDVRPKMHVATNVHK